METLPRQYVSYQEFKQVLDAEITRTAIGFVRIGFLLNYAEQTNIIAEAGYNTVEEFVKAEYEIDDSEVSRFKRIYQRFGVPGEPRLQDQYSNHGVAKLGIMLTLPDYLNEEISKDYSKSEITAIKREVEAENAISDIEVMCEEKSTLQQLLPEGLKQLAMQFVKDYPKEYAELYDAVTLEDAKDIMVPNNVATYPVRIPGVGKILMFMKANENIVATNVRNGDKDTYEWEDFFIAVKDYFVLGTDAKDRWCNMFHEPWPLEEKKAEEKTVENTVKQHKDNVQQETPAPRKESKVKTPAPKPKKEVKSEPIKDELVKEPEEQLPGQDSILNHPELLPDGMKVEHFAPVQQSKEEIMREHEVKFELLIDELDHKFSTKEWSKAYAAATAIVWEIKKIMELEGKN